MKHRISAIAAIGKNREIGLKGELPWKIPSEYQHYLKITRGHVLIVGRRNYELSLSEFKQRTPVVVTRQENYSSKISYSSSFESALEIAKTISKKEEIFVIGGYDIYKLSLSYLDYLYLSFVDYRGEADTYFPDFSHLDLKIVESFTKEKSDQTPLKWDFTKYKVCR